MFVIRCIIFHLIILNFVERSQELVELPAVEDNDILLTEAILRNTTNDLFSTLKFKRVKDQAKLKNYTLIHNYLVSLTLQDHKSLKEIARLTKTDKKNIDNRTENVMVVLNLILNEDRHSAERTEPKTDGDLINYVEDYLQTLQYLKNYYDTHSLKDVDINKEVLNILEEKALEQKYILNQRTVLNKTSQNYYENKLNRTNNEDDHLLGKNDFWVPELSGRRIYRGRRTSIRKFPFMASVQIFNQFQCGSSIIKSDLLVTAASCLQLAWNNRFYRENPAFLSVRVGTEFYGGGGENIGVLEVYFHPSYNPKNLRNNLAVMRLVRKIKFPRRKKGNVKMVEFDTEASALPMNTDGVTIVGWGARTRSNSLQSPFENRLAYAVLDIYPLEDCQDTYSKEYVTKTNFCAGFLSKGSGACNRDVGGPGIVSGYLTGVVSFGSPVCGTPDAPTVFTKVGFYADWIEEIMEQDVYVPQANKRTTAKTTTRFPFSINPQYTRIPTTWTVEPLFSGATDIPEYLNNAGNDLRQLAHVDLFKDFLKTMFDSKEIDQYIDLASNDKTSIVRNAEIIEQRQKQQQQLQQQQELLQKQIMLQQQRLLRLQQQTTTATDAALPNLFATRMFDMDPMNSEEIAKLELKEHKKKITALYKRDNFSEKKEDPNHVARKELEKDIMKLLDNTDLKSYATERMLETAKSVQGTKDGAPGDVADNLLTLLYVSKGDKGENGIKIFDDNDDDITQNLSESLVIPLAEDGSEGDEEGLSINSDDFRDFTYRNSFSNHLHAKHDNSSDGGAVFNDIFSKQVLFDILSEVIDDETRNKTIV